MSGRTLGSIVSLQRGNTYKSKLLGEDGPKLLGLASIARDGGFRDDNLKNYSGPTDPRHLLRPGDIYVSLKDVTQSGDLLGAVARVPERIGLGRLTQDTVKLVFEDAGFSPSYLYWSLRTPNYRSYCRERALGTANLSLSRDDFLAFELPPLTPDRATLVSILQMLDDKIELNRRMCGTLEAMARTLFRSWFVDFDPVRAKAAGEAPAHMDPATAALFPDRFGEDGLPEGWTWDPFARHATVRKGLSYKGSGLCGEADGVPLHNLNSVLEGGGYKHEGIKYYRGDHKDRHEVRPGDLIIANTEQGFDELLIGHSALVPATFGPMGLFSHHIYKLEPAKRSPLSREWFYLALSRSWIGVRVRAFSNGTTVNMLPADAFELPLLPIPPAEVVDSLNRIVRPMFAEQEAATAQTRTLAALRDALLPKLMSGELRVREAEAQLAEAV